MAETILLVGANRLDQQRVIWPLLTADYQIRYAASSSSAIKIISSEAPHAVLLVQEPRNTPEVCSLIRTAAPAMPVVVIRREDDTDIIARLFQADADAYVREPFDSAELIARIRSAIRRSKVGSIGDNCHD